MALMTKRYGDLVYKLIVKIDRTGQVSLYKEVVKEVKTNHGVELVKLDWSIMELDAEELEFLLKQVVEWKRSGYDG